MALVSFNDEFIAAMCGGLNDDDTLDLFMGGVDAMIDKVAVALERTVGHPVDVKFDGDTIYVDLDEEDAAREYGAPGVQMQPVFRQGIAQSTTAARLAWDKAVNQRG